MKAASRELRLLLLSSELPPGPGGIGTHAYQLARHLTHLGWAVHVLAPQPYATAAERDAFNRQQPFAVTPLPGRGQGAAWPVMRLRAIAAVVRAADPSVIVASGRRALWLAAALRPIARRPWIAVGHGSEFSGLSAPARLLTGRAVSAADAVVAVSNYTSGLIREAARPRRLIVIPNAADGATFRPGLDTTSLRHAWGLDGRRVLLTVGRVSERKAQDVVIRALPRIAAAFPDVAYVIAGLPEQQAAFAALADGIGVADRVRFTGAVAARDLPATYNLADLFVLVSRRAASGDVEGYGIAVQEAALSGVPAVVSRDCGLTEAMREGETGMSVPPDDPDATAEAVITLLGDEARRRGMGRLARERALAATWEARARDYDCLLREVVGESRRDGAAAFEPLGGRF